MKLLKEIRDKDVVPDYQPAEIEFTIKRQAARAIVFDKQGKVALLFDEKDHHYKIPGGGVDKDEELSQALHREIMEEAGCEIEVFGEVGIIIEYREQIQKEMTSYCYLANVVGEKGEPQYTEKEKSYGFSIDWVDLDEAVAKANKTKAQTYNGYFMRERDLIFLQEAKKIIDVRKKQN